MCTSVIAAVQQPRPHSSPCHVVVLSGIISAAAIIPSRSSSSSKVETTCSVQAVNHHQVPSADQFNATRVSLAHRYVMPVVVTWTVVIATASR